MEVVQTHTRLWGFCGLASENHGGSTINTRKYTLIVLFYTLLSLVCFNRASVLGKENKSTV